MTPAMLLEHKLIMATESLQKFFNNRIKSKYESQNIELTINLSKYNLDLMFRSIDGAINVLTVPVPFIEDGVSFIQTNRTTKRAVGSFYLMEEDKEVSYIDVMLDLLQTPSFSSAVTRTFSKQGPFLQKIMGSFKYKNTAIIVNSLQRVINSITMKLPVHKTNMNSWAMNNRVWIIDPNFDILDSPKEKLNYQIDKSKKFFSLGWTMMGLSDGTLADKNYILKTSLRNTIPFGRTFHNPQRNLYSTLGMKGDEYPLLQSETGAHLQQQGISRKGWNLFTAFIDTPLVWEDQILVDESVCDYYIDNTRIYKCFGDVQVNEMDQLKKGDTLSVSKNGTHKKVKLKADMMWVDKIELTDDIIGGVPTKVNKITIAFRRFIKEGTKITNMAANKGVVRTRKLGWAVNPVTGEERKIQVLVSCKAIEKRRNYTQLLEAMINNINGDQPKVYTDDIYFSKDMIKDKLEEAGFKRNGEWDCQTYAGKLKAVCGTVFWGITNDAEDSVWDHNKTKDIDNRGIRKAGLKFSAVEFRALQTRFGFGNNPIIEEVLSYKQGTEDVKDLLKILCTKSGETLTNVNTVSVSNLKHFSLDNGILLEKEALNGTILDDEFQPNGFMLKLPVSYQVDLDEEGEVIREGIPLAENSVEGAVKSIVIDSIYIPRASLRRCWKHESGKYGLSELGIYLTAIMQLSKRFIEDESDTRLYYLAIKAVGNYFNRVSEMLGSKRGELSLHSMSVRLPNSAKGIATLGDSYLPKNTIEIHRSTAEKAGTYDGDIVLVERFPCTGFLCLRPQKVVVTDDPMNMYTIRVSGNSLTSAGLDFDGDNLYIASFHTKKAKDLLLKEWTNPNKTCYDAILEFNSKAGKPHTKCMNLDDYSLAPFEPLTSDTHAAIVSKAVGVKANTGPVVALAYNVMRAVENSQLKHDQKVNVAVEVFLDKVANSVFKEKHGVKSLHEIVVDALCTADIETLVKEGFKRGTSTTLCNLIKTKAEEVGVTDLVGFNAKSDFTILNLIIRKQNKIYRASRTQLEGISLLKHLCTDAVDIPSKMCKQFLII